MRYTNASRTPSQEIDVVNIKLWIDDVRPAPDSSWRHCRTAWHAIHCLESKFYNVVEISFDHDLGEFDAGYGVTGDALQGGDGTSMPVAKFIEERAHQGIKPPEWNVHSMNPVGRKNLIATLESADRLYTRTIK